MHIVLGCVGHIVIDDALDVLDICRVVQGRKNVSAVRPSERAHDFKDFGNMSHANRRTSTGSDTVTFVTKAQHKQFKAGCMLLMPPCPSLQEICDHIRRGKGSVRQHHACKEPGNSCCFILCLLCCHQDTTWGRCDGQNREKGLTDRARGLQHP